MIGTQLARASVGAVLLALASTASGTETLPTAAPNLQIAGPVIMVTDLERSVRFYTDGLGLVVGSRLPGKPGPGVTVVAPGEASSPFILLRQRDATVTTQPAIDVGNGLSRIMLSVDDAQALAGRLRSAGYEPSSPNARNIFFVTDPDGYRYEVIQRAVDK
jgi:catechol 2,3-dioxygenase-like lactoylglutathione lyase family enzyme